ncbi:MAG: MBL fold metallo-hydrolase [Sphaerochaetaceae bacterium]|nr:MBL fold metallo-hydrolase [Sphaerochaetaceae bacterium]
MKRLLLCILAVLVLLTSCQTASKNIEPDENGLFTSYVFDTSEDSGKLTARYLALKAVYIGSQDKINAGDCTVYTSPEGLVMMVDCSNRNSFDEIDQQLQMMGVTDIDIFVMSHPHADHIGCLAQLARKYPIHQVYKNNQVYDSATYREAMDYILENNIPCTVLYEGDSFMFGEQVKVDVFNPPTGLGEWANQNTASSNNCSLALKLTYGDSSFWTSGDLYMDGELRVVEKYGDAIDSDVMKMNHHGYETSNNKNFIAAISPEVVVGMHESITSQTVAMMYSLKYKALTFYNCQDGAVRVSTPGDGTYDVQCQMLREKTFYGEPAANCHYTISNAADMKAAE